MFHMQGNRPYSYDGYFPPTLSVAIRLNKVNLRNCCHFTASDASDQQLRR